MMTRQEIQSRLEELKRELVAVDARRTDLLMLARMFQRRNVEQRPCDVQLLRDMYELTRPERQIADRPLFL